MILVLLFLGTCLAAYVQPPYADWAHSHVVWINGRQQDQAGIITLIDKYQSYGIKVGGALIDSAWSTGFNNFEWDRKKFPNPEFIIKRFHDKGIKVLLWATSVVNNDTTLYEEGKKNKYFLNDGKLVHWWHGDGAFVDYFNPKAVQWWHQQLDKVLDMGIDGFKCDGTDPMIFLLNPWPYSSYLKRYVLIHEYGHKYYGDFYNHTKSKNPDGLIMARPTDTLKDFASWNYAPKNVMFSGWVGDQDSSPEGLKKAVLNVLKSAWNGYLNFGFDIGGYRGQNISKNVFIRWVQLGALVPFMQNGGNGKHYPWLFDAETVEIYRQFVNLHYDLKPTFLTCGKKYLAKGKSVIEPLSRKIPQISIRQPSTYGYILCDNLLVFPIFENNGQTEISFPLGNKWIYFFNTKKVFSGNESKVVYSFNLNETPLFMRSNSIIAFTSQIKVIGVIAQTNFESTYLHGQFSDDFKLKYSGSNFQISVDRFYKSPVAQEETNDESLKVRLVGYRTPTSSSVEHVIDVKIGAGWQTFSDYTLLEQYQYR